MFEPYPQITCIDCGGRAFLLTQPREEGWWEAGDVLAYRCEDCLDRWDLVLEDDDFDRDVPEGGWHGDTGRSD